jgi:hypothetical protein
MKESCWKMAAAIVGCTPGAFTPGVAIRNNLHEGQTKAGEIRKNLLRKPHLGKKNRGAAQDGGYWQAINQGSRSCPDSRE